MKKLYFDWSGTKGIHTIDDNTPTPIGKKDAKKDVIVYDNFDHLFANLLEPTILIGEATFESFLPARRKRVIETANNLGHKILTTPTRATGRRREKLGWKDEKSDYIDPFVIRDLANDNKTHLKKPNIVDKEWVKIRETANRKLMIMRNTNIRIDKKKITLKDYFAKLIIEFLPEFSGFSEKTRIILGDSEGKRYSEIAVALIGVIVQYVKNTKEFDRLSGLYHHGYPCQIRSDFMRWRWGKRFTNPEKKNFQMATLTDFRREHRRLFHLIKDKVNWDYVHTQLEQNLGVSIFKDEDMEIDIKVEPIKHIQQKSTLNDFFV